MESLIELKRSIVAYVNKLKVYLNVWFIVLQKAYKVAILYLSWYDTIR